MPDMNFNIDFDAIEQIAPITQGSFKPNAGGQVRYFESQKHVVLLSGGNRAGKTYCGTVKTGYRTMPELDKYGNKTGWLLDPYVRSRIPDRRIVGFISSYSQRVQQHTVQKMVQRVYGEKNNNITDHYAEGGTWFNYKTELADVFFQWITAANATYTGANLDFVYFDEPHPRNIYNEAITRLVETHGYAWITMTPVIDAKDPDFARKMKYIAWMVDDLVRPFEENPDSVPEVDVIYVDLEENPYVDTEFAMRMWATMTHEERMIRKSGMFSDFIGETPLNKEMIKAVELYIHEHPEECMPEYGVLEFDDVEPDDNMAINFIPTVTSFPDKPDKEFIWRIWERPVGTLSNDTIYGTRPDYCIGADPAAGKNGRDYTAAYVRRMDTGAVVASLHGYIDEATLAYQLWLGGYYYCSSDYRPAKLVIENVSYGRVTLSKLFSGDMKTNMPHYDLGKLYKQPARGALEKGRSTTSDDYGWYTSNKTRGFLIDAMRSALADCFHSINRPKGEGQCLIPDLCWIKEAKTFILHDTGKYEAASSFYDDRLFALAMADMGTGRYSKKIVVMPEMPTIDEDVTYYMKEGRPVLNIPGLKSRMQKAHKVNEMYY